MYGTGFLGCLGSLKAVLGSPLGTLSSLRVCCGMSGKLNLRFGRPQISGPGRFTGSERGLAGASWSAMLSLLSSVFWFSSPRLSPLSLILTLSEERWLRTDCVEKSEVSAMVVVCV